jgi:hypothetical protein
MRAVDQSACALALLSAKMGRLNRRTILFTLIINYSKKVKEHCVQQAQFLSTNHRVVLPWCTQALAFIELPVDNVDSQDFNVSFAVLLSVRNLL